MHPLQRSLTSLDLMCGSVAELLCLPHVVRFPTSSYGGAVAYPRHGKNSDYH